MLALSAFFASAQDGEIVTGEYLSKDCELYKMNQLDGYHNALADSVLNTLSLRQKIAQLLMVEAPSAGLFEVGSRLDSLVRDLGVGGIIVFRNDAARVAGGICRVQELAPLPMLVAADAEWGLSMRYPEYPRFPKALQMSASNSEQNMWFLGYHTARQCRSMNIHINFAPVVDINRLEGDPVSSMRSYGDDKRRVATNASAYIDGMRVNGIFTCAKHFPGAGDNNVDSHKAMPVNTSSARRIDTLNLFPFRKAIEAGVEFVMVGHISVPALDSTGTPASISKPIITGLLKEKLGFDGIVITDALGMKGVSEGREQKDIAVAAYQAGVDVLLMPEDPFATVDLFESLFNDGELSEDELDMKVLKVLRLKARAGLFDTDQKYGFRPMKDSAAVADHIRGRSDFDFVFERKFASQVAKESMSVVAEKKGLLPLKSVLGTKVAYMAVNPSDNSDVMLAEMMRYATVHRFDVAPDIPLYRLDSLLKVVNEYDWVVVGLHNAKDDIAADYNVPKDVCERLGKWATANPSKSVVVWFGNPYALRLMPWNASAGAFMVAYEDLDFNAAAAVNTIFREDPALHPRKPMPVQKKRKTTRK